MQAVDRHGRDWAAVSRDVGSKSRKQCGDKVKKEVAAGRMHEHDVPQRAELARAVRGLAGQTYAWARGTP
jgi:hypothetical protein